jgi:hypothetical protein
MYSSDSPKSQTSKGGEQSAKKKAIQKPKLSQECRNIYFNKLLLAQDASSVFVFLKRFLALGVKPRPEEVEKLSQAS